MITSLKLPADRFLQEDLTGLKKKNFIYGKNGTGKSTVTQEIVAQYAEQYDVRVFQGFDKIIQDNGSLNTISLGTENAKLQPLIEKQQTIINELVADLNTPPPGQENTYSKQVISATELAKFKEGLAACYTEAARDIRNDYPELVHLNYNRTVFI